MNCKNWQRGIFVTQFAMTVGIFLMLALGLFELSLALYRSSALQETLNITARSVVVGYGTLSPDKIAAIKALAQHNGRTLGLTIKPEQLKICPIDNPACTVESTGSSGQFFKLSAEMEPSVFLRSRLKLSASATMRNE